MPTGLAAVRDRLAAAWRWLIGEDLLAEAAAELARLDHVIEQCEADRNALAMERNQAIADAASLRREVDRLKADERGHIAVVERAQALAARAATEDGTLYRDLWMDSEARLDAIRIERVRSMEMEVMSRFAGHGRTTGWYVEA